MRTIIFSECGSEADPAQGKLSLSSPFFRLETMTQPEPQILRYQRWLASERGLDFDATTRPGYEALWRWSVGDLRAF